MSACSAGRAEPTLFVISAPSGAGKTSLVKALLAADDRLAVCVSHTTRPRRAAETDGVDYHFVSAGAFASMRAAGAFLESALVFGHDYGTSREAVAREMARGLDVILEIDWQGAAQVRRAWRGPVTVFILPPSMQALAERLRVRGQDGADVIARRLDQAALEISRHGDFDHVVVNDDFDAAVRRLAAIVDGCRRGSPPPRADHGELLARLLAD